MHKPSKGTIKSNILESLETLGKDTAKGSFEAVKTTFNPLELLGKTGRLENKPAGSKEAFKNKNNYTKLDLKNLQEQYDNKTKAELNAYRQKLFQLVRSGEERSLTEERQKIDQQKQQENYSQQHQQEQKKKQQQAQQQIAGPRGKRRKYIFGGGKRKANIQLEQSVEYRQNAGK